MTTSIDHLHVKANGITFHVALSGPKDARPILCLHGFPEGWMCWRPIMEKMDGARIYAPDLRGYPGTDRPRGGCDVFTLTDDIRALIEALGLDRPVIVSHDWGGALGWIFAHRYSGLISKLVVINCTHPRTLVRAVFNSKIGSRSEYPGFHSSNCHGFQRLSSAVRWAGNYWDFLSLSGKAKRAL